MRRADAMLLIAEPLGITTLSYQYSNPPYISALMFTTADAMATFAEPYRAMWRSEGAAPRASVEVGYAFDSSFALTRERARARRARLEAAGAKFVFCFFDEALQRDKYGTTHPRDLEAELGLLLRRVEQDPTVGLILKPQFMRNSPASVPELRSIIEAAERTGRVVVASEGAHRNNVLPAEAALSADIAIGYLSGGTASLEAALAGARSVMLNPYGFVTPHDDVYARSPVVYRSMPDALDAIDRFRRGEAGFAGVGDWSPIARHFDKFCDGGAARRTRMFIESAFAGMFAGGRPTAKTGEVI
jgi:hypothetical protein